MKKVAYAVAYVAYVACVVAYVAYNKAFFSRLYLGILKTNNSALRQCLLY